MDVVNRSDCAAFVTKDTSEIRELMAYRNSSCERMSLAEATLYPGRSTERHTHPKSEEIYYVLEGEGIMMVAGEERPIRVGDAILIPPGSEHQTWNIGAGKLVFLCLCSPASEQEDTVIADA